MAESEATTTVWFAVKRADRNEETRTTISVDLRGDEKMSDVTNLLREKLELTDPDLIIQLLNAKGHFIVPHGRVVQDATSESNPLSLNVVRCCHSVTPDEKVYLLSQFESWLTKEIAQYKERLSVLEGKQEQFKEKRTEKIQEELAKINSTIIFLLKRMDDAEAVKWNGMFIRNPLW